MILEKRKHTSNSRFGCLIFIRPPSFTDLYCEAKTRLFEQITMLASEMPTHVVISPEKQQGIQASGRLSEKMYIVRQATDKLLK